MLMWAFRSRTHTQILMKPSWCRCFFIFLWAAENSHDTGYVLTSLFQFSPLADSFLVLMILAAYSWPVQSLTQRRTTEKAPLGNKDKGTGGGDGSALSASKAHLSYQADLTAVPDSPSAFKAPWSECLIHMDQREREASFTAVAPYL